MIDKNAIKEQMHQLHLRFVHSPIKIAFDGVDYSVVNLPIDIKGLIGQLERDFIVIKVRVWIESKVAVIAINKVDAMMLLEALSKRFDKSQKNFTDHLVKLNSLSQASQLQKLNTSFHEFYRPLLPTAKVRQGLPDTSLIGG